MTRARILADDGGGKFGEAVESAAHVGGLDGEPDARRDLRLVRMVKITEGWQRDHARASPACAMSRRSRRRMSRASVASSKPCGTAMRRPRRSSTTGAAAPDALAG